MRKKIVFMVIMVLFALTVPLMLAGSAAAQDAGTEHELEISTPNLFAKVEPGDTHRFVLNITNNGNASDVAKVMPMPKCYGEMLNASIEVAFSQKEVDIGPGETVQVFVDLKIPEDADDSGPHCLDLMVYSKLEAEKTDDYEVLMTSFITRIELEEIDDDEDSPGFGAVLLLTGALSLLAASGVFFGRKR